MPLTRRISTLRLQKMKRKSSWMKHNGRSHEEMLIAYRAEESHVPVSGVQQGSCTGMWNTGWLSRGGLCGQGCVLASWKTARDPLHDDKPEKAGVGPGLAFARAVVDFCSAPIGLVPCAFGGSEIQRWIADGDLLQSAKGRLQEGEAAGGVLKGILWHQGESDCGSEEMASLYPSRLHQLKQDLQTACGGVPMILGELGMEFLDLEDSRFSFADTGNAKESHINPEDAVNTSIVEFGTSGGTSIGCVSARGLQHKGDRLHFCRSSAEELGKRYAWKWLEMTGNLNLSLHTLVGDQLSPPFLLTAPRDLDGAWPNEVLLLTRRRRLAQSLISVRRIHEIFNSLAALLSRVVVLELPRPGECREGFPPAVWPASGKKSPAEALDAMRKGGPVRARRDAILLKGDLPNCWPRGYQDASIEASRAVEQGNAMQPPRSRAFSFSPIRGHVCQSFAWF
eukprot:g13503.t1